MDIEIVNYIALMAKVLAKKKQKMTYEEGTVLLSHFLKKDMNAGRGFANQVSASCNKFKAEGDEETAREIAEAFTDKNGKHPHYD
jgi:hypothetical protein